MIFNKEILLTLSKHEKLHILTQNQIIIFSTRSLSLKVQIAPSPICSPNLYHSYCSLCNSLLAFTTRKLLIQPVQSESGCPWWSECEFFFFFLRVWYMKEIHFTRKSKHLNTMLSLIYTTFMSGSHLAKLKENQQLILII